jgi:hypothetical protein
VTFEFPPSHGCIHGSSMGEGTLRPSDCSCNSWGWNFPVSLFRGTPCVYGHLHTTCSKGVVYSWPRRDQTFGS